MTARTIRYALFLTAIVAGCGGARHTGLPLARPDEVGLAPAALARIEPLLRSYVDSGQVAGVVAVIARHGRIGYFEAVGHLDFERRRALRTDAVFRIYSMTKPVVAAAVMTLVDDGRLSLDDPVSKYIPAFAHARVYVSGPADAPVLRPPATPVTVRHLLTHTAGLLYGVQPTPLDTIYQRAALFDAHRTLAQFADSAARLPLAFDPGTRWVYSPGIDVAGRVIEVAAGQPLDRFLRASIFEPLGMRDTGFRFTDDMRGRVPVLYTRAPDGSMQEATGPLTAMYLPGARFFWGGGGLLSTPADYLRFAQMLLNGGELDGVRVLTPASVAELMRDQLPRPLSPIDPPTALGPGYSQALGGVVLVDSTASPHPGSPGIYRWSGYVGTYFWIDPRADLIAMVWYQFSPGRAYPLEAEFQRLVYDAVRR